jgi:hypothetical protein
MTIVMYPYKMGSAGGKLLADELKIKRVYPNRRFKPKIGDVVINWGNGYSPDWEKLDGYTFLNKPAGVCLAVNKVDAFYKFMEAGVSIPVWTTYRDWAAKWIAKKEMAVARTNLEGFDGNGIKLCRTLEELPRDCKLFTKYIPITSEFRVYVFKDKIIDVLEKRRLDIELADKFIRTEQNHWVFCQGPKWWPKDAEEEAIKAVKALGLDFGGVDVIWNEEKKKSFVLEVNTAPGIYGKTTGKFAKAILEFVGGLAMKPLGL